MASRRALTLVLLTLVTAGCGSNRSTQPAQPQSTGPVWTSAAEPSPPGSGGRWTPADELQLLESSR